MPVTDPTVRAEGLGVVLGEAAILRGVDLSIDTGESVALLGANGSGKSTLVRAIVGVTPVTRGHVHLFGADVGSTRRRVPWHRVGYVPQRMAAGAGVRASALEVVTSGLLDNRRLWPGRDARARALAALEAVGLADRAGESVQVFSGGQQQRVLVARALVRRPDLLILDEPLAGMDRESKEALAGSLGELRERGATLLVVLHEMAELTGLVDRAVVLRHGRVVHDGAPPRPAAGHDDPAHDHVHPHEAEDTVAPAGPNLRVEL
ncbi:ATP-binding cassette domain-containing protein [Georgenia sp. 10Sc9-8]|uniref:ATP-binding cassette domain-containing protein n=1 Tax=Georgenia halotolerans TaxID=3028317 RepID=A0ABT5TYI0_9MICO|nr:ATP-binding cassette domain-containing protein [Georgenia halotolerans]